MVRIHERLIHTLRARYGEQAIVIVLHNVSMHTNEAVHQFLREADFIVRPLL